MSKKQTTITISSIEKKYQTFIEGQRKLHGYEIFKMNLEL
jgi:hypothetical protein